MLHPVSAVGEDRLMKEFKLITCLLVLLSICLCGSFYGCKKKSVSSDDRFTGSWRSKKGSTHKILTFKTNGTWILQFRKEGRLAKIVEKEGKANGKWHVKDGVLYMFVEASAGELDWGDEPTIPMEIADITALNLSLKLTSGRTDNWVRVKSIKQASDGSQLATVTLEPIIVNLSQEKNWGKGRYLCIQIEFILNEGKSGISDPTMHPKVRETAIFFLSSLTYREVNTMQKIDSLKYDLYELLKPYISGNIEKISIKDVVVTSQWKNVETFLAQTQENSAVKDTP